MEHDINFGARIRSKNIVTSLKLEKRNKYSKLSYKISSD